MNDAFCSGCNCERCRGRQSCCRDDICPRCRRPWRSCCCETSSAQGGYLLPRILASGREWVRCMEATIRVRGLPEMVAQPLSVCQICAGSAPPRCWEDESWSPEPRAVILLVEIPLDVTLRDAEGCLHRGQSEVLVRVRVPLPFPREQCWRNQWVIQASVRMLGCPTQACEDTFCARLEANVEAFMVRSEAVCRRECQPQCVFPTPLFPPPPQMGAGCCC